MPPPIGPVQARSGVCFSGVTSSGWTPPNIKIYIAFTDQTAAVLNDSHFTVQQRADGSPDVLFLSVKTITPVIGSPVVITYTTPYSAVAPANDEFIFAGTITNIEAVPVNPNTAALLWHCTATGLMWLADLYDLLCTQYTKTGVNTMVADILTKVTDGGTVPFRVGYIPQSLGDLDMNFLSFPRVSQALQQIAKAAHATLEITPTKIVNLYQTYPEAALATITDADIVQGSFTYKADLTQVRDRTLRRIAGTQATLPADPGATTLTVVDTTLFQAALNATGTNLTSIKAISGVNRIAFTGVSWNAATNVGNLTGCTGIIASIKPTDAVDLLIESTDTAAKAALATTIGNGVSGQATHFTQDVTTINGAIDLNAAELADYGAAIPSVTFRLIKPRRHLRAGRTVTLSVTTPLSVSGTFVVQTLTTTVWGPFGGTDTNIWQTVTASAVSQTLTKFLRKL